MIPALIRKIDAALGRGHTEVVLWGDGTPTREFLYVEDAAEAIVLTAERYDDPEPMNLGSGHEVSIAELARMVAELLGFTGRFTFDTSRPNGQPRRGLDVSRAAARIGWRAASAPAVGQAAAAPHTEGNDGR